MRRGVIGWLVAALAFCLQASLARGAPAELASAGNTLLPQEWLIPALILCAAWGFIMVRYVQWRTALYYLTQISVVWVASPAARAWLYYDVLPERSQLGVVIMTTALPIWAMLTLITNSLLPAGKKLLWSAALLAKARRDVPFGCRIAIGSLINIGLIEQISRPNLLGWRWAALLVADLVMLGIFMVLDANESARELAKETGECEPVFSWHHIDRDTFLRYVCTMAIVQADGGMWRYHFYGYPVAHALWIGGGMLWVVILLTRNKLPRWQAPGAKAATWVNDRSSEALRFAGRVSLTTMANWALFERHNMGRALDTDWLLCLVGVVSWLSLFLVLDSRKESATKPHIERESDSAHDSQSRPKKPASRSP